MKWMRAYGASLLDTTVVHISKFIYGWTRELLREALGRLRVQLPSDYPLLLL